MFVPPAYVYGSWAAVPAEAQDELRAIYGVEDFERFGSYDGYRIGITAAADWVLFVGGD